MAFADEEVPMNLVNPAIVVAFVVGSTRMRELMNVVAKGCKAPTFIPVTTAQVVGNLKADSDFAQRRQHVRLYHRGPDTAAVGPHVPEPGRQATKARVRQAELVCGHGQETPHHLVVYGNVLAPLIRLFEVPVAMDEIGDATPAPTRAKGGVAA